ncbi:carbon-nitrogen hydrolase family protein [Maritimibacter sp. HL-12]|uniref:carbon-nitrogen hydrolase family protein n=1 Tax=Maritimibacter sp. HL-12 TaxID=1162418 RepID=UPI000A0F12AC|nr:carbon-nitrogen hydrolase family protein [Maritimibacter sp. HL-12]SMH45258.1 Predicted amidohydrolase [Maritimibacter sp. HL-12]
MRAGLIQLTSRADPAENLPTSVSFIREAAARGAEFVLTPEVTNIVSADRGYQASVLVPEEQDGTLAALRHEAGSLGIWLLIGSLALKTDDHDGRFANRSFLISPTGDIAARYDKIHMFDVEISSTERYRESAGYRPGGRAVVAEAPFARIGLTICYDLRFPHLYRRLAQAGADILTVPSAFSQVTGAAHWESLLRARAIETGCFILAPAQTGNHGPKRATHGHSLAISPWGEVLADGGTEPGVTLVDFDLSDVEHARKRIPSLDHDREFEGP